MPGAGRQSRLLAIWILCYFLLGPSPELRLLVQGSKTGPHWTGIASSAKSRIFSARTGSPVLADRRHLACQRHLVCCRQRGRPYSCSPVLVQILGAQSRKTGPECCRCQCLKKRPWVRYPRFQGRRGFQCPRFCADAWIFSQCEVFSLCQDWTLHSFI